jgi:SOS-response transcriptional repressor LexA
MAKIPTEKQVQILCFIQAYVVANEWPPTLREIMQEFCFTSLKGASNHLCALERKGFLFRLSGARQMRITEKGRELLRGTINVSKRD